MKYFSYQQKHKLESWYWWFISWQNVIKIFVKKYLKKGRKNLILDIGCGSGYISAMLNGFGKVFGIDISEYALGLCREKNLSRLCRGTTMDLPFKNNSFNTIVCAGVLYHEMVKDDEKALKEMFRVCEKGGVLVILEPAFEWLRSSHDITEYTRHRYALGELCSKARESGFKIKKASYRVFFLFPIILIIRYFKKIFLSPEPARSDIYLLPRPVNKLLAFIMEFEDRLLVSINFPVGSTVVCVAVKP